MPTLRNKTGEELYVPALRELVGPGESIDIADDAAAGFADQTDTWELTEPAPPAPAPKPQAAPAPKE